MSLLSEFVTEVVLMCANLCAICAYLWVGAHYYALEC
jgi:hypothetical protein